MRALCWHGKGDVRVDTVPDPVIESPGDAIVRVTSTAICGSDLHLLNGYMPAMKAGDILGHEFMGEVVEVGAEVKKLKVGDRVVVPFVIACGGCFFCERDFWSGCETSNPNAADAAKLFGHSPAGMFGYTHLLGGFSGGQAEYVRVPFADVGAFKAPAALKDEQVLFLSDILPTGWMAAENANIRPGDTVAVWGCGPVGQFAIASALLMKAGRVIAIDRIPERLALAKAQGADVFDFTSGSVKEYLDSQTEGRGPDSCIDAVGMEAHGWGSADAVLDKVKAAVMLATDRIHALREAIMCCRKFGTVSFAGVYGGLLDNVPFGAAFNKGLALRMGQTPVHFYLKPLLERIEAGEIEPSFVITHRMPLAEAPEAYRIFRDKEDACIKVVLSP